jgi:hypothetical protein
MPTASPTDSEFSRRAAQRSRRTHNRHNSRLGHRCRSEDGAERRGLSGFAAGRGGLRQLLAIRAACRLQDRGGQYQSGRVVQSLREEIRLAAPTSAVQ